MLSMVVITNFVNNKKFRIIATSFDPSNNLFMILKSNINPVHLHHPVPHQQPCILCRRVLLYTGYELSWPPSMRGKVEPKAPTTTTVCLLPDIAKAWCRDRHDNGLLTLTQLNQGK